MKYIKKNDIYTTAHYLGRIMQGIGAILLVPLIIGMIYGENVYIGFLLPTLSSLALGTVLNYKFTKHIRIQMKHGMLISALAWLWASIIGALIMVLVLNIGFENALFENMSAWTGSGFTIFSNVEALPYSILFLRSIEQWVGGLGVIIIFIGILIRNGTAASKLYESEARDERIKPSMKNTMQKTLEIYGIYTILGIILYLIAGMPLFDAINATFTSISTGGMSIKNTAMNFYHNDYISLITVFLMILGSVSFSVHYKVIKTKGIAILKDIQFQILMLLIIVPTIIFYFTTNIKFMDLLFQITSAATTTGANLPSGAIITSWPPIVLIILMALMLIGGSSGSTSSSIKIIRVLTFLKGINLTVLNQLSPETRVIKTKIRGKGINDNAIKEASNYIALTFLLIGVSWAIMTAYGFAPFETLFNIISVQTNNGVWIGPHHSTLPVFIKYLLILDMWIGRLEVIPVFVLFRSIYEVILNGIKTETRSIKDHI